MNKTDAEAQAVLQSKVNGVIHLDEALRDMPLDFLFCFLPSPQKSEVWVKPIMPTPIVFWSILPSGGMYEKGGEDQEKPSL